MAYPVLGPVAAAARKNRSHTARPFGAAILVLLAAGAALAQGAAPREDRFELSAAMRAGSSLQVSVAILPDRLDEIVAPPQVDRARATIAGISLGQSELRDYPAEGETTAVLFLLDISNPARQPVVEKNLEQIEAIARAGSEHHRFALATFAETLQIAAEMGSDPAALGDAGEDVRAVGQRTELIRLGAEAVDYLDRIAADRKVIVLMSDGEAEDDTSVYPPGYFAEAARRVGVRVYALGFHPSREETFGKMRFIAEQSGGALIRADRSYDLPESYLADPFAWPDAGGTLSFDAAPVIEAGLGGVQTLEVIFELASGEAVTAEVDVVLPEAPQQPPGGVRSWLLANWPVGAAAGAVLAMLAGGLAWRAMRRRAVRPGREPIAYLEFLDREGTRWPIRQKSIKIGRNSDNDLQLKNDTVSAYHATIHLQRDGAFIITDLNSLNGVSVNGEPVEIAELADGSEFELGEVRCRFTVTGASAEGLLTGPLPDRTLSDEGE